MKGRLARRFGWGPGRPSGVAAVSVALVGLLILSACSRHRQPPRATPDFHVVLLMESGTPPPLRQALESGLRTVASDLFAATAVRSVPVGQSLIEALRRTGREAPDLVFCHVPGEGHVVVEEAAAYLDTQFVTIPGRAAGANVTGVVFRVDGAAYVAGATLAAAVGGRPLVLVTDPAQTGFAGLSPGFRAGAASAGGKVGGPVTPADAAQEAGGGRWGGVFFEGPVPPADLRAACAAAGIPLVTLRFDPREKAVPGDFGAVVIRLGRAMRRLAREQWAGTLEGRIYSYGLGSGVVDFEVESGKPLPENVLRAMDHARADVLAGIAEIQDLEM